MICQQTKNDCDCMDVCQGLETPKPTMQEIERLVDAYAEKATFTPYAHPHHYKEAKAAEAEARAALMAAIRQLSNSTQDSE